MDEEIVASLKHVTGPVGYLTESGQVFEKLGELDVAVGQVDDEGGIYNTDGELVGQVLTTGILCDQNRKPVGRVDRSGTVYAGTQPIGSVAGQELARGGKHAIDIGDISCALVFLRFLAQNLGIADDRVERRPQFVTDVSDKLGARPADVFSRHLCAHRVMGFMSSFRQECAGLADHSTKVRHRETRSER